MVDKQLMRKKVIVNSKLKRLLFFCDLISRLTHFNYEMSHIPKLSLFK